MSQTDEARQVREHKDACTVCGKGSKLLLCEEGERLINAAIDKLINIQGRRGGSNG